MTICTTKISSKYLFSHLDWTYLGSWDKSVCEKAPKSPVAIQKKTEKIPK